MTLFSAISIIECIYNLVALPKVSSMMNENQCELVTEKVKKGVQCLEKLAYGRDTVAQTAYHVLKGFLQPGICTLHGYHERGSNCSILVCFILSSKITSLADLEQRQNPKQNDLSIFNPSADELSNLFQLTEDSFRLSEPGSYVGLDIDFDSFGDAGILHG